MQWTPLLVGVALASTQLAAASQSPRCNYPDFPSDDFFWESFSNEYDDDFTFAVGTRAMGACSSGYELVDPANPFSECLDGFWTPVQGCMQSPTGYPTDGEGPEDPCQDLSVYGVAEETALRAFEACITEGCIACGNVEMGMSTCVSGFGGMGPNAYFENVCPYMESIWTEEFCPQVGCGVRDTPSPDWSEAERKRRTVMTQVAKVGDECGSPEDATSMTITMDFGESGACRPGNVDSDGPLRYLQWHCESDGAVMQVFEDPMCMDFYEEKRESDLPAGCVVQTPGENSPTVATMLKVESPCGSDDHCFDWPRDWKDATGSGCSYYEMGGFCSEPWVEHLADASGVHARTACCACGGGQNEVPRSSWSAPRNSAQVLPLWLDLPSGSIEGSMQYANVFELTLPSPASNASDLRIVVRPSREDPYGPLAHICCGSMGNMYDEPDADALYECSMAPVARGHSAPPRPSGIWGRDSNDAPGVNAARGGAPAASFPSFTWPVPVTTPRHRNGAAVVVLARGIGSQCDLRKPLSLVVSATVPYEVHARLQAPEVTVLPLPVFYVQTTPISPSGNDVVFEFKVPRRTRSLQFPMEAVGAAVRVTAVWNHWQQPMGPIAGEEYLASQMPTCIDVTGKTAGSSLFFKFHSADGFAKIRIQALVNGDGLCDFVEGK